MQTKQQTKEAAAMAVVGDDELTLLDFVGENTPRKASEKIADAFLFEEILDPSVDAIPGLLPTKNSPEDELNGDELNGEEEEEEELEWLLNKDAFPSLETSFEITSAASPVSVLPLKVPVKARSKTGRKKRRTFAAISANKRRCRHCEAEETPQWRTGPEGPKTLCNACGVRFRKGRLVPEYRPINSPTFSAELHSNSHRRIIGMRKKRGEEDEVMEEEKPKKGRRGRPPKSMVVL